MCLWERVNSNFILETWLRTWINNQRLAVLTDHFFAGGCRVEGYVRGAGAFDDAYDVVVYFNF